MGKLRIAIADSDTDYLKSFERFLIVNYPHRFELFSFSSYSSLSDFLNSVANIDLLIVADQLYQKSLRVENISLVLLLSEDWSNGCSETCPGTHYETYSEMYSETCSNHALSQEDEADLPAKRLAVIRKYQHMDRFIAEIMRLYAANSQKDRRIVAAQGNTRVISILSSSGGSGKSTIAAACSSLCAGRGSRTFYLNLESIPSTDIFFHGDSTQSFSNVIFHLKGKGDNLGLKLEGAKTIDTGSNVHYYKPPANVQELNELTQSDFIRLIGGLKNSGIYDIIFIDTSCGLSPINTAIIENSDIVMLVMNSNSASEVKLKEFMAGLDLLERKWEGKLAYKVLPVFNLVEKDKSVIDRPFMGGCERLLGRCELPVEISDYSCQGCSDMSSGLLENRGFLSDLSGVADYLLGLPIGLSTVSANNYGGGDFID